MCGILLHHIVTKTVPDSSFVEYNEDTINRGMDYAFGDDSNVFKSLVPHIIERGPNYASFRSSQEHSICWLSSVLSLRQPLTKQSIECADRYIVQYNGELYNTEILENDTQYLIDLLKEQNSVADVLRKIYGEFAYTIYDKQNRELFFGRDCMGRRSLSYRFDPLTGELFVASVSGKIEGFENCEAGIIYCFDTTRRTLKMDQKIQQQQLQICTRVDNSRENLLQNCDSLYNVLMCAVTQRVRSIHPLHIENNPICVLFSGGLDCSVIAAMICQEIISTEKHIELELLNVGFENPRTGLQPEQVPDRILAQQSVSKLKSLYPEVNINLIEVDVSYEEYLLERPRIINLIYPKQTEMDLSIAAAFYFASKGKGFAINSEGFRVPFNRRGIVLFSGLGADELYGGYHKFANKPIDKLSEELSSQISNIHDRNLNRDDKVIAANGVEVRYPFLDDNVVNFSVQLPINYKLNKMILREVASQKLQLDNISKEPKRAIQFGAKSARMTKDGNKHGTDLL